MLSFVKGCVHLSFEDFLKMIYELKILPCIPPLWNMRPPLIYPQPHLYDHRLAILACITPFQNMRPLPIFTLNQSIPFHLKWSFWRSDFSPLISSKPLSPQETEHRKREIQKEEEKVLKRERERERERKRKKSIEKERKSPRISSNKRGSQYFERRKIVQLQKPFYMIPFSPPPSYHFENLFQIIEKVFVTLFEPSFSLAIYQTWVAPLLLTHELHIFSL
jgi:hypothetical protein